MLAVLEVIIFTQFGHFPPNWQQHRSTLRNSSLLCAVCSTAPHLFAPHDADLIVYIALSSAGPSIVTCGPLAPVHNLVLIHEIFNPDLSVRIRMVVRCEMGQLCVGKALITPVCPPD